MEEKTRGNVREQEGTAFEVAGAQEIASAVVPGLEPAGYQSKSVPSREIPVLLSKCCFPRTHNSLR